MQPTGGEVQIVNWLTTLGVGGALAAFMFILYRRDIKQYTDLWMRQSDQLIGIVKENTESNVKLTTLIESKFNGQDAGDIVAMKKRLENLEVAIRSRTERGGAGR